MVLRASHSDFCFYIPQSLTGSLNDNAAAREELLRACATPYAQKSDDYMAALAQVHVKLRGWSA
jgi:hypothetical protein